MATLVTWNCADEDVYGQAQIGQLITPDANWLVSSVAIENFKIGGNDDAYCKIWSVDGSNDPDAVLATSDATACTATFATKTFTFSTPYLLTSGVAYWFIFSTAAPSPVTYWSNTSGSQYASGVAGFSVSTPDANWTKDAAKDFADFTVTGTIPIGGNPAGQALAIKRMLYRRRR